MIRFSHHFGDIPVYIDPLMKDNEILKGNKEGSEFFIIRQVVADMLENMLKKSDRDKKINEILEEK